ncbi:MAG: hypothetical protein ABIG68_09905 [Acidobacteriota bacterium]
MTSRFHSPRAVFWTALLLALTASGLGIWSAASSIRQASVEPGKARDISAAEFSRLVQTMSEEEGYFLSDNFISNETAYLHVAGRLRAHGSPKGAYIGVGPEQNFTYIAQLRPSIAFIVDIRRQAVLQHLMYKAIFHLSENRARFLSLLLSRPLGGKDAPDQRASILSVLQGLESSAPSEDFFRSNLARIRKVLLEDLRLPLSLYDQERLEYVYSAFRTEGLDITYRMGASYWGSGYRRFPALRDLIMETDLDGNLASFLAGEEDYGFVRSMHLENRIIPVVGDFAGSKALASVGEYLRRNGYTVRAFYTSNVEQYLFRNGVFPDFAENVRRLPIDGDGVFIRSVSARGQSHPARVSWHRNTTLLQKISVFLEDFDQGLYRDYWSLVTSRYITDPRP